MQVDAFVYDKPVGQIAIVILDDRILEAVVDVCEKLVLVRGLCPSGTEAETTTAGIRKTLRTRQMT